MTPLVIALFIALAALIIGAIAIYRLGGYKSINKMLQSSNKEIRKNAEAQANPFSAESGSKWLRSKRK